MALEFNDCLCGCLSSDPDFETVFSGRLSCEIDLERVEGIHRDGLVINHGTES